MKEKQLTTVRKYRISSTLAVVDENGIIRRKGEECELNPPDDVLQRLIEQGIIEEVKS